MAKGTFGGMLLKALKEINMTPQALARELEISAEQVQQWLRNKCKPPFLVMLRVMEITHKNESYFFDESPESLEQRKDDWRFIPLALKHLRAKENSEKNT